MYFDIITYKSFVNVHALINVQRLMSTHCAEKLSPGFTFTLSLCQSTTTQPYIFTFMVLENNIC